MKSSQCPERQKEAAKAIKYDKWKAKQDAEKKQTQKKGTPTKENGKESAEQAIPYELGKGAYDAITDIILCNRGDVVNAPSNKHHKSSAGNHKGVENAVYSANVLGQQSSSNINIDWCLLDNQSTVDIFCNAFYLSNIRTAPRNKQMHIHCNTGVLVVTKVGNLAGYGMVWYHHKAIANILSQSRVEDRDDTLITYNSRNGEGIVVHDKNDETMYYNHRCSKGLFYIDMS